MIKSDIYLSYSPDQQENIIELKKTLEKHKISFNMNMCTTSSTTISNIELAESITNGVKDSKCVLCLVENILLKTERCAKELSLAYAFKRPIIVLMMENLSVVNIGHLAYFLIDQPLLRIYENLDEFWSFNGDFFDELLRILKTLRDDGVLLNYDTLVSSRKSSNGLFGCFRGYFERFNRKRRMSDTNNMEMTDMGNEEVTNEPEITNTPIQPKGSKSKIKSTFKFKLPSKHLRRIAFLESKKQIVICDVENKSIINIDLNGNCISSVNPENTLQAPSAICVDSSSKIYVSDWVIDRVFVYSANMKYLRYLDLMIQVDTAYDMAMDNEKQTIYASDSNNNVISVINRFNGHLLKTFDLEKAKDMAIFNDYLYVLSDRPNNPLIMILDKTTFDTVHIIKLTNLCFVRGLHVDSEGNCYLSAYEHDSNGNIDWTSAYLYTYSMNGKLIDRLMLNLTGLWDMLIYDKRIYLICEKEPEHFIVELE